ncbi:MAG TPA: 2-hydroxyacyl-CoA dehydratase family protein, partial [Dehalococcoidia bacterium]|nr:2-hydroxyacyl-CoA dehydratase family protein [Dehalococcoidia bacterium]
MSVRDSNGSDGKPELRYQGAARQGMQELFDDWYEEMGHAKERGRYVVYNWIAGNLRELFLAFDMLNVYPEINSLQSGVKKQSLKYIIAAEEYGYSPDVCAYVKADVGLILAGMKHPRGKIPPPDLIFNNSFCNTFIKWSETLQRFHGAALATVDMPGRPKMIDYKPGDEEYDNQKRYVL